MTGALVAVCGVSEAAQTGRVSRLVATELARRAAPGAVLLTSARGGAAGGLAPALERHTLVVADAGPVDEEAGEVLRRAAVVVCTFPVDIRLPTLARALTSSAAQCAGSARWVVMATSRAEAAVADVRRLATWLPCSRCTTTLLPADAEDDDAATELATTTLLGALT